MNAVPVHYIYIYVGEKALLLTQQGAQTAPIITHDLWWKSGELSKSFRSTSVMYLGVYVCMQTFPLVLYELLICAPSDCTKSFQSMITDSAHLQVRKVLSFFCS